MGVGGGIWGKGGWREGRDGGGGGGGVRREGFSVLIGINHRIVDGEKGNARLITSVEENPTFFFLF